MAVARAGGFRDGERANGSSTSALGEAVRRPETTTSRCVRTFPAREAGASSFTLYEMTEFRFAIAMASLRALIFNLTGATKP